MTVASEQGSNVADFIFRIAPSGGQQGQSDDLTPETLRVTGFAGREGINEIFSYRVELCTDDIPIELESMVGAGCCLEIRGQDSRRLVQGVIRQFERTGHGSRFIYYAAEVVPQQWYLSRRQTCRIFQKSTCDDMSVPGIIKKVLLDAGLLDAAFEFRVDAGAYPPREYVVQYRESDLNFITRLCEDEGIFFFFEHRASGTVMVFADVPDAHKDARKVHLEAAQAQGGDGESTFNDPAIPFRSPSGMVHERYAVFDARARNSAQVGAVTLDDFEFQRPEQDLQTATAKAPQERFTALSVYDYPAGRIERADGGPDQVRLEDDDAVIRLQAQQCQRRVLTMATTARHLVAGCWFTLVEHPDSSFNGDYVITHLSAHATQTQSTEEEQDAVTGARFEINLTAIPRAVPYRPPRVTPRPTVLGSQTAIVVKQKGNDDEIYVDEFGRVKVQFHWDQEQEPEESSMFVRVAQSWSGAGWGFMFIPRVGQEVIVDFLEGDPDRPIVTGRVYNRTHMPPYKLPDEKTKSTIKTHSTEQDEPKRFHEIRFEDKNKSEQLFIRAQRRMDTRVLGTHYHTAGGSLHEHVGGEDDEGNKKGRYYRTTFEGEDLHNKGDHYQLIDDIRQTRVEKDVLDAYMANYALYVKDKIEIDAADIILNCSNEIALKCGGNFILVNQQGVTIVGMKVKINSGGSAPSLTKKDGLKPLDAVPADTGKPGRRGRGGRPRTREGYTLDPHAPPPPPPPPPPPGQEPPVETSPLECGIARLRVVDPEGSSVRAPSAARVLQIVCATTRTQTIEKKWLNDTVTATFKCQSQGRDELSITIESNDGKPVGRKQSLVTESSAAPGESGWVDGPTRVHPLEPPDNDDLWTLRARPDVSYVYGRGCDRVTQRVRVESYPNQQIEVSLGADPFKKWAERISKKMSKVFGILSLGGSPVNLNWELKAPAGSISAKWGWAEDTDWRAYYLMEATIAVNPIIGISFKARVSFAQIALSAYGLPPFVTRLFKKYLGDIYLEGSVGLSSAASGSPSARCYASGEFTTMSKASISATGTVSASLGARVGSDGILSAEIVGTGTTGITGSGEIEWRREGMFAGKKVMFDGLKFTLKIVGKVFEYSHEEQLGEWQPFEPAQIYPSEGAEALTKIFPPDN
ncbi:MAG: type VI secretion system tip protein VgrG [Phycisphaerae bacterium]|jgi:type VI secretion system secreted protein VgrG